MDITNTPITHDILVSPVAHLDQTLQHTKNITIIDAENNEQVDMIFDYLLNIGKEY